MRLLNNRKHRQGPLAFGAHDIQYGTANSSAQPDQRNAGDDMTPSRVPIISRKVKACSTCRKHKIRCIMDNNAPPCRRCAEKGLGCVLNKSLQTLISERSQYVPPTRLEFEAHDCAGERSRVLGVFRLYGCSHGSPLYLGPPRLLSGILK